jgi:hypothetical protein
LLAEQFAAEGKQLIAGDPAEIVAPCRTPVGGHAGIRQRQGQLQSALATLMRGRTSFVIAHRLSTIRSADRILVLEGGSIVEAGSHDELIARAGAYREMVELQSMEEGG